MKMKKEDEAAPGQEYLGGTGGEDWQVLMSLLGDFFFVVDPGGTIIHTNPVASHKLGYRLDELVGMNIFQLYPPSRSSEAEDQYSQIIMGEKFLCDIPFQARDGSLIEIETKVSTGRWRGQNVIFSISRDVSASKSLQYEMRIAFEKLKTIIDSVAAYIWSGIIDARGLFTYLYQSPVAESITGRRCDFFYPGLDQWLAIVHPDDREAVEAMLQRLVKQQSTSEWLVYRIIHADGSLRWVRDNIIAREFGEGQVRLDGIVSDVTESRAARQALEDNERRLKGILASMADMVFAFDSETRFTFYHTPEMGNLYIEPDKFTGERHDDIMPVELHGPFGEAFDQVRQGRNAEYEYWLTMAGRDKCFHTKLSPIMSDGHFQGAVAVVRDITRQKELEEELRASESRYRELFDITNDGYARIDMTGHIMECNPAFQRITGYDGDELRALTYRDLTPPEYHPLEQRIIDEQVMTRNYSDVYHKEYLRKDGSRIAVELKTYLVRDREGKPAGLWAIVRTG